MNQHLCKDCFEIDKGYYTIASGQKRCVECGGVVLSVQEAADYIAELTAELRELKEIYGDG